MLLYKGWQIITLVCKSFNLNNLPRDEQTKKYSTLSFKLLFVGPFSRATQRTIKVISKKYCKDLDVRLILHPTS